MTSRDKAAPLLRWAIRFARLRSDQLVVLCHTGKRGREAALPVSPEWVQSVKTLACELDFPIEVRERSSGDPVALALAEVESLKANVLLLGADGQLAGNLPYWRTVDRLLRFGPCDVVVVDPGDSDGRSMDRVFLPFGGASRHHALRVGVELAEANRAVAVPFLVGTNVGHDSTEVARRELATELAEAGVDESEFVQPAVDVAKRPLESVAKHSHGFGLMLTGSNSVALLRRLRGTGGRAVSQPIPQASAIALVRRRRVVATNFFSVLTERISLQIPKLKPRDRVDLFDRLQEGSRLNVDFVFMLGLSAAIAALGLLQDSVAIVIGAMLVAPLMTPLIGCGLALTQGNTRLFGKSTKAAGFGVLGALLVSFVIGLLTWRFEMTPALLSRGGPNLLDLPIAFFSGMAAAYAMSRPSLLATLAGVAIATALVPPLATVGIALSHAQWQLAFGASTLFVTNFVAIILGAGIVFRLVGMKGTRPGFGNPLWLRRVVLSLFLGSAFLVVPLWLNLNQQLAVGTFTPLMLPASEQLRKAITARVESEPDVQLYLMARPGTDPEAGIRVVLISDKPLSDTLRDDLLAMIHGKLGPAIHIQLLVFRNVDKHDFHPASAKPKAPKPTAPAIKPAIKPAIEPATDPVDAEASP